MSMLSTTLQFFICFHSALIYFSSSICRELFSFLLYSAHLSMSGNTQLYFTKQIDCFIIIKDKSYFFFAFFAETFYLNMMLHLLKYWVIKKFSFLNVYMNSSYKIIIICDDLANLEIKVWPYITLIMFWRLLN